MLLYQNAKDCKIFILPEAKYYRKSTDLSAEKDSFGFVEIVLLAGKKCLVNGSVDEERLKNVQLLCPCILFYYKCVKMRDSKSKQVLLSL
jgi:hypothetical protein